MDASYDMTRDLRTHAQRRAAVDGPEVLPCPAGEPPAVETQWRALAATCEDMCAVDGLRDGDGQAAAGEGGGGPAIRAGGLARLQQALHDARRGDAEPRPRGVGAVAEPRQREGAPACDARACERDGCRACDVPARLRGAHAQGEAARAPRQDVPRSGRPRARAGRAGVAPGADRRGPVRAGVLAGGSRGEAGAGGGPGGRGCGVEAAGRRDAGAQRSGKARASPVVAGPFTRLREVVVVDVETTGLDPSRDRVVEVAAARGDFSGLLRGETTPYFETFEARVDPGVPIPEAAARVHGIRDEDVQGEERFADVAAELRAFIGTRAIIVHNSTFDTAFLNAELARAGVEDLTASPTYCTMRRFRALCPGEPCSLDAVAGLIGRARCAFR